MNAFSTLIGLADFEWDESTADVAVDASLQRVLGRACHSMVLLCGDYGLTGQKRGIPKLQFGHQINLEHASPTVTESYGKFGEPALETSRSKKIHGSWNIRPNHSSRRSSFRANAMVDAIGDGAQNPSMSVIEILRQLRLADARRRARQ
jgi:hypothetical protein